MQVTLTPHQIALATRVGEKRNGLQRGSARVDDVVHKSASLERDIHGAIGELAVALAMNQPWTNALLTIEDWLPQRQQLRDVGAVEVKTTAHPRGCLLLQSKAADAPPYVLVVLDRLPVVRVVGWLYGHEVKQPRYWRAEMARPCFMAPQKDLRPFRADDPLLAEPKHAGAPDQRSGVWPSADGRSGLVGRL